MEKLEESETKVGFLWYEHIYKLDKGPETQMHTLAKNIAGTSLVYTKYFKMIEEGTYYILEICSCTSHVIVQIRKGKLSFEQLNNIKYRALYGITITKLTQGVTADEEELMDEGIRSLIPFMSWSIQKENPLLRLTVENCELSSIGVIILLDCLTNAKQLLDVLSIADNHLGSPVAAALARFLGSHVRALNATDIGLGTVGFQILEETLPTEVALSHINISVSLGSAPAIADSLAIRVGGQAMSRFWKPGSEKPSTLLVDDEEGGVVFLPSSSSVSSSGFGYASLERQRQRLPVYKYRKAILYLVERHATTIVVGETGSGKSTQIPQYLKEAGWADGGRLIGCTQPRRLAVQYFLLLYADVSPSHLLLIIAFSTHLTIEQMVASRVAEEVGVKLGEEVGYTIRFEDQTNPGMTMIKFLTDGVLIREMMEDPLLTKYSVIMVDEAHERSISTDMLLGLLKKPCQVKMRIAYLTSHTIEIQKDFLNNCHVTNTQSVVAMIHALVINLSILPYWRKNSLLGSSDNLPSPEPAVLSVEGKGYTVEIHYVEEPVSDYLQATVNTVLLIHEKARFFMQEPPGDILVFLTGQDDIEAAVKLLNEEIQHLGRHYLVGQREAPDLSLVSDQLPPAIMRGLEDLIFAPTSKGKRKVVLSTNIAETSLTLEGVVYVVDSGFSKQKCYNPISDIESLVVAPISKASARQRAGRAGRVRPGKCFRIYTEEYYLTEMQSEGIPEMQRSNLVSCIIQLKALGIDNILGFDWPASPSPEAMIRALEVLFSLGILDEDAKLTVPIGFQVAEIPLDPMISKMILSANDFGCSDEILTIASFLSVQSVWVSVRGVKKEFDEAKLRFAAAEGDHVTFLNIYKGFHQSGKSSQWCYKNFLNYQALKKVVDIRGQLLRIVKSFGIQLKSCDRDMQAVRKAIIAGSFTNACHLELTNGNLSVSPGKHSQGD
ncbi:putative pre-mRNA-splicing factor ATP-dependent RNA helicase DEAH9 [Zea mays]|uniref:RNA helicase n=1 Tax=Zea mays TaxID=4577 RepID=A0A1D6MG09_MAIZE|nr:putative pre-mRNA-splicing factor ATP-dependent RNA helicase DEAH9 [Zea mays]ONM28501.1 putative pre-mRNA-splicing factor ATP-dependent RNA helicase DEAH9 [Zea mays]ONM28502.1 putative pre-mRNA-splicing factor ATP-dependent RNA helicase DEAH9 [Zea mays]ONM28506.1 putative pre-mRNA-splicing factor ATP-dependent RNA helicase DEAH9 [Zea mays]ONM28512.1 putative pre-mRNA-splicing factor ATP-dependent RNA helicase DEAH9 [Zea mays]